MSGIELVGDDRGGVTVMLDGLPQSYVDPADPQLLAFEYVEHLAAVLDVLPPGRLAVTHVGGGGLTLPRYLAVTRPASPQIVLEPDAELTARVRRELPLPRGHRIRVRDVAGGPGLGALADGSADAVVLDAYHEGRMPADLAGPGFAAQVHRVLRPGGLVASNVADEPGLRFAARLLATQAAAGLHPLALVATHDVLKGRRFGNAVVVAGRDPDRLDLAALTRRVSRAPFPTGARTGEHLDRWLAGARAFEPGNPRRSPPPPEQGRWRVR